MDASKRLVNLFFSGAVILAWVTFSKFYASVFSVIGTRDTALLGKQFTLSTAFGVATAVVAFIWIWRHAYYRPFVYEAADELVKVIWPDWEETKTNTKVTIWVTVIIALVLWVFDQVFGNLTNLILGG